MAGSDGASVAAEQAPDGSEDEERGKPPCGERAPPGWPARARPRPASAAIPDAAFGFPILHRLIPSGGLCRTSARLLAAGLVRSAGPSQYKRSVRRYRVFAYGQNEEDRPCLQGLRGCSWAPRSPSRRWLAWPRTRRRKFRATPIKIGVLSDFSGPFADQVGKGSLVGAQLAAEDFAKEAGGLKVEVIFADHQNKPDIGVAIARRWVDEEGVDAIVDLANSGVGLAVNTLMHEKNRAMLASATATSDLTGKFCQPTTVQWALDTWALGNAVGRTITKMGGSTWYLHQLRLCSRQGSATRRDRGDRQGGRLGARLGVASARRNRFRLLSVAGASLGRQSDRSRRHRRRRDQRHPPGGGVSDRRAGSDGSRRSSCRSPTSMRLD